MRTGLLARQAEEKQRIELQQAHERLVELLSTKVVKRGKEYLEDERLVEAVLAQQKAWTVMKEADCELAGVVTGGASTWQSARAVECEMLLTRQRTETIRGAVRCLEKAPSQRGFCLKPTMPFVPADSDDQAERP